MVRRLYRRAAALMLILPVLPFYYMAVISDKSQDWGWAHALVDKADEMLDG